LEEDFSESLDVQKFLRKPADLMESLVQSNDRDGKPMVYIMMRNDENL
jgi:hypothetical protein